MNSVWEGKKVRLRAVEPADWEKHFEWDKDTDLARNLFFIPFPQSRARTQKWTDEMAAKKPDGEEYELAIETLDGQHVGMIATHHCDPRTGTFRYGIGIAPAHQRQGYASDAIRILLRYMFEERRYQKCTVEVYEYNPGSVALHESLGFQQEGRLRRMLYTRGQFYDMFYYGITAEEFLARYVG